MLIHNAILTGSISLNGSDVSNITGSAEYSASFSSRITNTEATGSTLTSASSSFSTRTTTLEGASGSFSTRVTSLTGQTGSYATTGSNSFKSDQIITGSVSLTGNVTASNALYSGNITAQTLVVQTVTSSVLFSTGSNKIGSTLANVQEITGSLYQTGSVAAFTGNVGIGTNAPTGYSSKILNIYGSASAELHLTTSGSGTAENDGLSIGLRDSDGSAQFTLRDSSFMAFGTADSEKMRITSGGSIAIGGSTVTDNHLVNVIGNQSSGNVGVVLNNTNSTHARIYGLTNVNGQFSLWDYTANAQRFYVSSSGAAVYSSTVTATGAVRSINGGVDATFQDAFVGVYSGNNNEQNAIQTSVSSVAASSGFRFQASNGGGSASRTNVVDFRRDRALFYTNVGIGTTSPGYTLDISGNTTTALRIIDTGDVGFQVMSGGSNNAFSIRTNGSTVVLSTSNSYPISIGVNSTSGGVPGSTTGLSIASGGAATFASSVTAQSGFKLPANGNGTSPTLAYNNSLGFGVNGTGIFFGNTYNSDLTTAMQFRVTNSGGTDITSMTLLSSGNVGIGITNPSRKFVVSNGGAEGTEISPGSGYTSIISYNRSTSTWIPLVLQEGTGNVLVGTTSDNGYKFNVAGSIYASGAINAQSSMYANGGIGFQGNLVGDYGYSIGMNSNTQVAANAWYMQISTSWSNNFRFFYGGTGVGAGSAKAQIDTSGNYSALSDINKKKDIVLSTLGLNEILQLKPSTFKFKDDVNEEEQIGFIAQEVKEVIPHAYYEDVEGDDKFIGLKYNAIVPVLVKAIQELKAEIEILKNR